MKKISQFMATALILLLMAVTITACSSGSSNSDAVGKYFKKGSQEEYIELKEDNTFQLIQNNMLYTGKYEINDKEIQLTFTKGGTDKGTIENGIIIDSENLEWKK